MSLINRVLVVGSFLIHFMVLGGCVKSFAILYHEFKDSFEATYTATGWIVSITGCLMLLLGM